MSIIAWLKKKISFSSYRIEFLKYIMLIRDNIKCMYICMYVYMYYSHLSKSFWEKIYEYTYLNARIMLSKKKWVSVRIDWVILW